MQTIDELITLAGDIDRQNGWFEPPRTFGELISLIHSEVSEALECYRNNYQTNEIRIDDGGKLLGIPIELADIVIRVFSMAKELEIDLENAINLKLDYNSKRTYRHGGKKI